LTIPETRLSTWSNRGADTAAQNTHRSIRSALAGAWRLQGKTLDTFLQGSYRNATNVRGDSDVDLVAQLKGVFVSDTTALAENQKALYRAQFGDAAYGWTEFRSDVLASLRDYYGSGSVREGKKALKIGGASNRLTADVVVALEYRLYRSYRGRDAQEYVEGIWFRDMQTDRAIVNYPGEHYDNGAAKNDKARTDEQFKPVVRMFKNARGCLVDRGMLSADLAPSYFIQCLLYNVPDTVYVGSLQQVYCNLVNWLRQSPLDNFICQNGIVPLFGTTPEQWDKSSALALVAGLIKLWNTW